MTKKSLKYLYKQKNKRKLTCLTAYTTSIAKIIDNHVDMILSLLFTIVYKNLILIIFKIS